MDIMSGTMKEFVCQCQWTWIIDLPKAKVFGPIYMNVWSDPNLEPFLHIGRERTMEEFMDDYSDCYNDLERKLFPEVK